MDWASKQEENRRLKKLYNETLFSCEAGAYYNKEKHRIIKFSQPPERKKFAKRTSTRKIRASDDEMISGKGNRANRLYDYKWEVD